MKALNGSRHLLTTLYVGVVAVAGFAALAITAPALPFDRLPEVVLFALLCGASQRMPVQLFRSSAVSVSFALTFAGLIYLGPAAAVWINLASGIVICFTPRPKPIDKMAFNVGLMALGSFVAGVIYDAVGGPVGVSRFEWTVVPPALLAVMAYFFLNTTLLAGIISLTSASSFRVVWDTNYRWLAPNCVGLGLVGIGMGVATQAIGVPGLAIFLLPLGMAWYSFKLYMARTEEVRRRNEALQLTNAQLDVANARLNKRVVELDALNRIGLTLNGSLDLSNVLGEILEAALRLVPGQAAAIALVDPQTGRLSTAGSIGLPEGAASAFAVPGSPLHQAIEQGGAVTVADTSRLPAIASTGARALIALPLHLNGTGQGAFVMTFATLRDANEDERRILSALAEQASTAVRNARLYAEIEQSYLNTVQAMVQVVDTRERYAQGHSERVRAYASAAARQLGLDSKSINTVELAALFHDLGHIGVPETVLNKPGALSKDEWDMVRKHPLLGVTILKQVPHMDAVVPVILQHHERYDGQGYPAGLLGDDSSVLAQILAVADAYEAMTSHRPHRRALTREQAVAELRKNAGSQFSPRVVDAFVVATETAVEVAPVAGQALLRMLQI